MDSSLDHGYHRLMLKEWGPANPIAADRLSELISKGLQFEKAQAKAEQQAQAKAEKVAAANKRKADIEARKAAAAQLRLESRKKTVLNTKLKNRAALKKHLRGAERELLSESDKKKAALKETVARYRRKATAAAKAAVQIENGAGDTGVPLAMAMHERRERAAVERLKQHTASTRADRKQEELDQLA